MTHLYNYTPQMLDDLFDSLGEKKYRTGQLMTWMYAKGESSFDRMLNLSKSLRTYFQLNHSLDLPRVISEHLANDETKKWLLDIRGNAVETVLIPDKNRLTLCVSSQVGCALDCQFCSTGKQGFNSNLSLAEILSQVIVANEYTQKVYQQSVTNVVFMGMGEPLLNFDPVLNATNLLMDDRGFGLSRRRTTISTSGIVPAIYRLAESSRASLAISLHAAQDDIRSELMPINRKYPINMLLEACHYYLSKQNLSKNYITVEYTLLKGVNDAKSQAIDLANRVKDLPVKVNLIPWNPFPGVNFESSSKEAIQQFKETLINRNVFATVRKTRGDQISAACGQLVGRVQDKTIRQKKYITRMSVC